MKLSEINKRKKYEKMVNNEKLTRYYKKKRKLSHGFASRLETSLEQRMNKGQELSSDDSR